MTSDKFVNICQALLKSGAIEDQTCLGVFKKHRGERSMRIPRKVFCKAFIECAKLAGLRLPNVLNLPLTQSPTRKMTAVSNTAVANASRMSWNQTYIAPSGYLVQTGESDQFGIHPSKSPKALIPTRHTSTRSDTLPSPSPAAVNNSKQASRMVDADEKFEVIAAAA
ncbi:hypothetical protein CEUSTIGMA_g12091.t1 [Chlamydomonas eustigma]|uniref:Uncharacterized protein n=1 Tax=Chlamydomonas eustigma TaxID=1157962 RepID=A0A250XPE1_9CHLO|nr:hypothetical protein CEUSTIGMA_g12091.t1 [Chlamydomonas eustigma]|eukprot:GAX84670.1 hypothetical protein CEUSTIGMA_g12091.t1 [Chlamydomonas eustigma]